MEMIMSTLAWELAGDIAPAEQTEAKAGFWSRFIESRQARANRRVCAHLVAMGDERLMELGFSKDDIRALRMGVISLPNTQEG
jgi:uncharacterized protein YjiS (DUF1127 family)